MVSLSVGATRQRYSTAMRIAEFLQQRAHRHIITMGIDADIGNTLLRRQLLSIVQNLLRYTLSTTLVSHRNSVHYGVVIFVQPPLALYLIIGRLARKRDYKSSNYNPIMLNKIVLVTQDIA